MEEWVPPTLLLGAGALVVLWMMNSFKASRIEGLENQNEQQANFLRNETARKDQTIREVKESTRVAQKKHIERVKELKRETARMAGVIRETGERLRQSDDRQRELTTLIEEKNRHFPWLATAFSDYHEYLGKMEEASFFARKSPHPKPQKKLWKPPEGPLRQKRVSGR